jgi:[histone H3]-lysine36 N-dimethyltransferase SETMAR
MSYSLLVCGEHVGQISLMSSINFCETHFYFSSYFRMSEKREQRVCIKFCQKLGKTATETHEMLQVAFGEEALSRSKTFEWHSRFSSGRTSTDDDPRSGRPSTSHTEDLIARVNGIIRGNRRLTIREVAEEVGIAYGTCQAILTQDLGMRRISAKFVPRLLSLEQKDCRLSVARDLSERAANDAAFLSSIITGDETWVFGYDPETKRQSSQWKTPSSPRPKKARQVRSSVKTMLIVFFDTDGVVHHEFVPQGQTVNQWYYLDVLKRLRDAVRRKRHSKWQSGVWMLHHDNAPAHSALSIVEYLAKHNVPLVPQPPYSPDLSPPDFFLFPRLKRFLKGHRFQDVSTIIENTTRELMSISKEDFQSCFAKWQERWNHCVYAGGDYFEGDTFA